MGQPVNIGDIIWYRCYDDKAYKAEVVFVCDNQDIIVKVGIFGRTTRVVSQHKILGIAQSVQDKAMDRVLKEEQKHYG